VANAWTGAPPLVALGIGVGNTLEAILGAYAIRRLVGFHRVFDSLRHVFALIVPAAMMSTIASATLGVTSLALGGIVPLDRFWTTWRAWWVGDVLGDLVVAPFLLAWASAGAAKRSSFLAKPGRLVEALLLAAALLSAGAAVFSRRVPLIYPFESSYVLLLAWAAIRFELRGAATATVLVSACAIWGTTHGTGPFVRESLAGSLLAVQLFVGCAAFTPLVVAGAISDRARAIQARESFVRGVSHDLKIPLNAVRLSASLLAQRLPDVPADRVRKHDHLVERSIGHMTRLIADLSDAAAIEAGKMSVDAREENARGLVEEARNVLQPLAEAKTQNLLLEAPEDAWVTCDHARILQVLSNLVGNAIKFSPEGTCIVVGAIRTCTAVRFFVRDQGRGIEPGERHRVFERYWCAPRTAGGGTGLGLFLAKGIVEAHGGTLWFESTVGVGTVFYFTVPISEPPRARNEDASLARTSRQRRAQSCHCAPAVRGGTPSG
jgi:signal transduction histidine kinase